MEDEMNMPNSAKEVRHAVENAAELVRQFGTDYPDYLSLHVKLDMDQQLRTLRDFMEAIEARARGYSDGRLPAEDL